VNIKIAGKWMFIPLKIVLIGIDPYPYVESQTFGILRKDGNIQHFSTLASVTGAAGSHSTRDRYVQVI
jgi:hypothetical protein